MTVKNTRRFCILFTLSISISSCVSNKPVSQQQNQSFALKATSTTPDAVPTSGPTDSKDMSVQVEPGKDFSYQTGKAIVQERPRLEYTNQDLIPIAVQDYEKFGVEPGRIQIVFKDEMNFRLQGVGDGARLTSSSSQQGAEAINAILLKNHAIAAYDAAYGMKDYEVLEDQRKVKQNYQGYIPSRYAIQTHTFPKDTDLVSLVRILREMPGVHTANLSYKTELSAFSKHFLGSVNTNKLPLTNPSPPPDPGFNNPSKPESTHWWWFNRHKVFDGWNKYHISTMPTVAVIDSGFDISLSAVDRPNYLSGVSFIDCAGIAVGCTSNADVAEPTHPNRTYSHGTLVASILGSPKNNGSMLAGVAPNAPIYPIRIMKEDLNLGTINTDNIATAIRHARLQSNIDVISMSLTSNNNCPSSLNSDNVKAEIASAISNGKIVVVAAGNNNQNLQSSPAGCSSNSRTGGEIVVGGVESDMNVSPHRTKGWIGFFGKGSNYDTTTRTECPYPFPGSCPSMSYVDIAAAAEEIRAPWFNPNNNNRGEDAGDGIFWDGTSLATPMVAGTAGMMKKIAAADSNTLSHHNIRTLLIGTADMSRYTGGYPSGSAPETKFLGENMDYQSGNATVGVRSLNVHNAIVVARYMKQYDAIIRLHNIDDRIDATVNGDWANKAEESYGRDAIWGLKNMVPGDQINFRTYNNGGGYAYGYGVFRYNVFWNQGFEGVSGVYGAENNNSSKPVGYYAGVNYGY